MHVHLLGTGAPFPDPLRTTTMLAATDAGRTYVVDCGGDVVHRLAAAGVPLGTLAGVVVTHEHADHVGGFALMVEQLWLAGRRDPLPVFGIAPALAQARRVWEAFDTSGWEGLPPLVWTEVEARPGALVVEDDVFRITAAPVVHAVPTVGLRVEAKASGRTFAYSCDTEPCPAVVDLARGAHLLLHEATGAGPGHSSAAQAAAQARAAGVPLLVLVHLPPGLTDDDLADARAVFPATALGKEGGRLRV